MASQNFNTAWSSELSNNHSEDSLIREHFVPPVLEEGSRQEPRQVGRVTIDVLPDNALLEIFHFYRDGTSYNITFLWRWETLTQVCRRWRHVVFGSPRRLDLRLVCTSTTPVSRLLHIWPPFPISIYPSSLVGKNDVENIIAALECRDRISDIHIWNIRGPELEELVDVLHEPLPLLTGFSLYSEYDESMPVLPETFLGGSAPRLQSFQLTGIPFPSIPKFILCSTHIHSLWLDEIPNSGYIPPNVMVTCLTALTHLKRLCIGFQSPPSDLLQLSPPHLTRATLPALSLLRLSGANKYIEDFVARIDTPRLTSLKITFFMDLILSTPRLRNFIDLTEGLKPSNKATIRFSDRTIKIVFGSTRFKLEIRCEWLDQQLLSITQIFGEQLPLLSHVEQLELREFADFEWEDDLDMMDSSPWLELFRLFVAARTLHVSKIFSPPVARAFRDLTGETATEVLPVLQSVFVEGLQPSGPVHEAMKSFATARQLSHQPVVITRWER